MAENIVTSPDGKEFVVTAPDGATQDEIIAYARQQGNSTPPASQSMWQKITNYRIPTEQYDKSRQWGMGSGQAAYNLGGAATDVATKFGASPEVAGGAGYLTNLGAQLVPALFGGNFAAAKGQPILQSGAQYLMQSALKPSKKAVLSGDAGKAVNTLLDEGINVSQGGAVKLQSKIDALRNEADALIANSTATIDKGRVAGAAQANAGRAELQVNPLPDMGAYQDAITAFLQHPLVPGKTMPVQLAQQLKQGTYGKLAKSYGEMKGAEIEAQKALARGLKEEISAAVPGVAETNAQMAPLINAGEQVLARNAVSGNKDPATFALLAGNPAAALALQATRSELFKSLLARSLNAGSRVLPLAAGTATGGILGMSSGGNVYIPGLGIISIPQDFNK